MKRILIGAAAAAALACGVPLATAQQAPMDKEKGPAAQDRRPEGKVQREPGAAQQPKGPERPRATEQPGRDRPRAAEQPGRDRPKATDRPDKDRPRATERPDKDRPKATERPDKGRPKATERPDRDQPRATERPDKDRPKATERPDKDRPKAAEPETGKDRERRVQVSEKQRTDVGARLRQTQVEKTKVNVSVNIGRTVPRSVRLRPLPVAIFTLAPAYRGYSYVVLEDETIVIVDARTYVIVDAIPVETRRVERPGALALSAEQMRFIYQRVPRDRTVDVRVRLALGAEVPRSVELLPFPGEVLERVPDVRPYRFVVATNDDVVLVDPTDNAVVLVIAE